MGLEFKQRVGKAYDPDKLVNAVSKIADCTTLNKLEDNDMDDVEVTFDELVKFIDERVVSK